MSAFIALNTRYIIKMAEKNVLKYRKRIGD